MPQTPKDLIDATEEIQVTQAYRFVRQHPMVLEDGSIGLPALSIPVENKDEFSCPPEHVEALKNCVTTVNKIVTIGWRATERDFLQLLSQYLPESVPDLMVVSGSEEGADETCDNLGILNEQNRGEHYLPIDTGFTGLINNLAQLETFLRR
jgi:hypothetical protein